MSAAESWFLEERGITPETLKAFGVEVKEKTATFPYPGGNEKVRYFDGEQRRFVFTAGATPGLFNATDADKAVVFVCEGETDTMRLWQELPESGRNRIGVVGLGGVHTWRADFAKLIGAKKVWIVLDNDTDYMVKARVDETWREIRHDLGPRARRLPLPSGVKDLCEFFNLYPISVLDRITKQGQQSRFSPLDLTRTPPPPDWLWEGWIALGDLAMAAGGEGLGKSWLTMALTVAVADGHSTFLGAPLRASGNVLYVDEENPEDVVYSRLNRLGLQNVGHVRYLWNNGVRMDLHPEELLDEALDFAPKLIVLDSLTRLHTKEENHAGDMATIMNNAIKPLARETGAAVLLIHHHNNAGSGARGSGDIKASPDVILDLWRNGRGSFRLRLTKSRRRLTGDDLKVRVVDNPDGTVGLMADADTDGLNDLMGGP